MADEKLVEIIKQGSEVWNKWRKKQTKLKTPDLSEVDLSGVDLSGANLHRAYFYKTNLQGANLRGANLHEANFHETILTNVDLSGANLEGAFFANTILEGAILTDCYIYGLSAWALEGSPKEQSNLIITRSYESLITVDDIQVAQFIYLLLNRKNLRNVIKTISSKAVLILGRFTPERKVILDAIAEELRKYNLLPIIFDFERAESRDFTETIKILTGLSLFVIADITNPKSSPLELQATVPDYQIPFVTIIEEGEEPFSMFSDLIGQHNWVLDPISYVPFMIY